MDSERVLEDQTVVVVRDRIVAMDPADEIDLPAFATTLPGDGLYLMPGLVDMHAPVDREGDLLLFLANGVTTVRNMAGGPRHLEQRERIARGELLGPTMYTAGPVIDGPVERWPGNALPPLAAEEYEVIKSRSDGSRVVRQQQAAGYDFVKIYDNLSAEAYAGVTEAARELGIAVAGHVPFGVGLTGAIESKLASIEHLRGYVYELVDHDSQFSLGWDKRSRFLAWNHIDATRIPQVVHATTAAGIWNVPTLTRYQKNMMPTEEHRKRYTSLEAKYVQPSVIKRMLRQRSFGKKARYGAFVEEDFELGRRVFQEKKNFTKALHDAGGRILLGSDDWFAGFATHLELQNLVDAGLSPYEALAAGTSHAAAFLDGADEFGRVEVGLRADLLLVADNPLTEVRNAKALVGVMLRGQWLDHGELRRKLDQLAARYESTSPADP